MDASTERARRRFLKDAVGVGGAVLAAAAAMRASAAERKEAEDEVSPTEDLMREHGVLRRILLVYGEVIRRVEANQPVQAEPGAQRLRRAARPGNQPGQAEATARRSGRSTTRPTRS